MRPLVFREQLPYAHEAEVVDGELVDELSPVLKGAVEEDGANTDGNDHGEDAPDGGGEGEGAVGESAVGREEDENQTCHCVDGLGDEEEAFGLVVGLALL